MFIREVRKQRSKNSGVFFQYNLVQTSRIEDKVKQRVILYLGSESLLKDKINRAVVLDILKAKIFNQQTLFNDSASKELIGLADLYYEKYCLKYGDQDTNSVVSIPPSPDKAEFHNIDIEGLELENSRTFGGEHLCKQVLDQLKLRACFSSLGMNHHMVEKCLISIAARALFSSSDYKTAQILEMNSELSHCFGYPQPINHKELYEVSDVLYKHKDHIDEFLYNRITTLFNLDDRLVIFDISNTYFETGKRKSKIVKYGRSKEKRSDCPLVVFTGVINAEGFIRHSRIYQGNKADTTTLTDMLDDLKQHSPQSTKQTVVMDAGIATDENLALVKARGHDYICVSRHRLNDYPIQENKVVELTDRGKSQVTLGVFSPEGYSDTWLYVQSEAKRAKEESIQTKLKERFEEELKAVETALHKKGGTKKIEKVWERIGRLKEKHSHVSSLYEISVTQQQEKASAISWQEKTIKKSKEDKTNGVYFIRTSYQNPSEKELWMIYNTIREVESTFRCLKSDLQIRPVHHQNDERIEAHIYLTMLAYQLVNTIRHMLKKQDIHHDWKNIVRIMSTQTIQTVILPTDKKTIHLRKPSNPIQEVRDIYKATNAIQTIKAVKKYVVYH